MKTDLLTAQSNLKLSSESCKELYRKMRLIRRFEERRHRTRQCQLNCWSYARVYWTGSHRRWSLQHAPTRGCDHEHPPRTWTYPREGRGPKRMMAELLGRENGYNRGKGGRSYRGSFPWHLWRKRHGCRGRPNRCWGSLGRKDSGKLEGWLLPFSVTEQPIKEFYTRP